MFFKALVKAKWISREVGDDSGMSIMLCVLDCDFMSCVVGRRFRLAMLLLVAEMKNSAHAAVPEHTDPRA